MKTLIASLALLATTTWPAVTWADMHADTGTEGDEVEHPRAVQAANPTHAATTGLQVVRKQPYGAHLADAEGRAVYLFTKDAGSPTCTDACARAWPPVTTDGEARAVGDEVREPLLDTTKHPSGKTQVTYAGHPLYYFARDAGPGEVRGQDIRGFGGEWYLISPTGEKVGAEAETDEPQR